MTKVTQFDDRRMALLGRMTEGMAAQSGKGVVETVRALRSVAPFSTALTSPRYVVTTNVVALVTQTLSTLPNFDISPDLFPTARGFLLLDGAIGPDHLNGPFVAGYCWDATTPMLHLATIFDPGYPGAGMLLSIEPMPFSWQENATGEGEIIQGNPSPDEKALGREGIDVGVRTFSALLAFMGQRLVVTGTRYGLDRAERRRLARGEGQDGDVTEYVLRRGEATRNDGESEVEWSCRWIVSGHWRLQPYGPGSSLRRPQFIPPYIKGPEGAPLRMPTEKMFRVAR